MRLMVIHSPAPKQAPTPYNWEYVDTYILTNGDSTKSWELLGNKYKRNRRNVQRWYYRESEKRSIREKNRRIQKTNIISENVHNLPRKSKRTRRNGTQRLGKYNYERNIATGHISKLDNHDWLSKYDVTFRWDRTKVRDEMIDHIWRKWGLVVIHRGFGKSKIEWGLVTRYILEQRGSWLEITDGKRQAKKIYKKIKGLLHRKEIRRDYGDVIATFDGSELAMELEDPMEDDPVIQVATRGGSIIGMHPRVIGIHDMLQKKYKSDESEEDLRDWWDEVASYLRTFEIGRETRITGVITLKGEDDLYSYMFSKGLKKFHRYAIIKLEGRWANSLDDFIMDEEGDFSVGLSSEFGKFKTLDCPNWPLHALLYERFINYHAFEQQMQGRLVPKEGNYFHSEDWQLVAFPLLEYGSSAIEIFTDPSWNVGGGSQSCAMAVTWYRGELHVIQLAVGNFGSVKQEAEYIKIHTDYEAIAIHFENDFSQMKRAYDTDSPLWKLRGVRVFNQNNLPGGKTNQGKEQRINELQKPFRMQRIKIHVDCNNQEAFKKQTLNYKGVVKTGKSWDILDTLATAYKYMSTKGRTNVKDKVNQEITISRF